MNRDHLRVVADNGRKASEPCQVHEMQSFTFAQFAGGMIVLHNDKRISATDAMVAVWKLLEPSLRKDPRTAAAFERKQPLFQENRHERGYPADRPRPICAETEGDGI
jgi:hypothetical protein